MLRSMSIRSRLVLLSMLLVVSLVGTNLVLITQLRLQSRLIGEQAQNIEVIVRADTAVQSFGNLKYWLTDLAVSQLPLSRQKASAERKRLDAHLSALERDMPEAVAGVSEQVTELVADASAAGDAYARDDRLVGNTMMARGRAHILAVDSKLSTLVGRLRTDAELAADGALRRTERGIQIALWTAIGVTLAAGALTLLVVASVVTPLRELVAVINAMTSGEMEISIPTASHDEIGSMAKVLTLFRDSALEREQAHEMLRRQAFILEQLYDAVVVVDVEDRIMDWNPAAERIFGYSKDEMLGGTTDGLYLDEAHARQLKMEMGEHMERTGRWVGECDNLNKDGEIVRLEAAVFRLRDRHGDIVSTIGVSRDISDRKKAQDALRESEARLATIIDHMPATVFLRDLEGRFIMVNRYYAEFYQLDPASIPGKTNLDLFPLDIATESGEHDRQAIEKCDVAEHEYTIPRPDGPHILWSVKFPILDAAGELVALGGVELDITERKRTEALIRRANEAAAAAEARLLDAIENMSEAIVVYDAEDRLVLCNSRFKEFYYYSDADVAPGISYAELGSRDIDRGTVIVDQNGTYMRERDAHRERLEGALDVQLKDGRWLQIRERMTSAEHIVSIQADVTERKRAEIALVEAKEEAEQANQAKSQFLANMSHELRTPLNAIIGITEMLSEDAEQARDAARVEALSRVHRAGRQLLGLINEILDLSKIEAGEMAIHFEEFNLDELIDEIVTTAEPLAARNDNELSIDRPAGLGTLSLDETRVRQVVLNLISNACKFTENGVVRLSLEERLSEGHGGVSITVSDTGIGITAKQMETLFRPFSQGDVSTSRKYGGTGLGLAISQHFCQMMGGRISVQSEPGEGSSFSVWFPRRGPSLD